MNSQGIRNAWEEIHNQPYRAPDKVPDRVIDAPIPERWRLTLWNINNASHTPGPSVTAQLIHEVARLEADKQDARTALLDIYGQVVNGRLCYFGDSTGYTPQIGSYQVEQWAKILGLSKPTAAKQGDPSSANRAEGESPNATH